LGLEANEKFGLLGFNGSGKSTTFKCITNELFYDSGEITLFGYNNKTSFSKLRTMIGYCPQENPLFDYLTVRELLSFYKSLKRSNISIEDTCNKFGIGKYIDKYCVDLSGGNKRKLTFAIALMNYPKILLLDEPSTGVDPQSRRIMWKNINELSSTGNEYNMILTTHSMEEAEILCDTVSWLRSGNFVCVGNPEKLKILSSSGYKLHIKFKDDKIKDLINNENFQHKNLCDLKIEGAEFIMSIIDKYQTSCNDDSNIVNELCTVNIDNAIGGYKCKNGEWDKSVCEIGKCTFGYYYDSSTCKEDSCYILSDSSDSKSSSSSENNSSTDSSSSGIDYSSSSIDSSSSHIDTSSSENSSSDSHNNSSSATSSISRDES